VNATTIGRGNAGAIALRDTEVVRISGSTVSAESLGTGNAGSIEVSNVGELILDEGALVSSLTTGSGRGGNLSIATRDQIKLLQGSRITAASESDDQETAGLAGSITIDAGKYLIMNGADNTLDGRASISTETNAADGGDISVKASDQISLWNSEITTSVRKEGGNGGNIFIDPVTVLLNHSDIIARAIEGNGGNITIITDALIQSADSSIDASSQLGISGTVDISSPVVDLSGQLLRLQSSYLDAAELLRSACAAQTERAGSFILRGRDRIPPPPDAPLGSRHTPTSDPSRASASNPVLVSVGSGDTGPWQPWPCLMTRLQEPAH
jgi:hypothetical protein